MKAILALLLFVTFSSFCQTNETAYSLAIKLSRFEYKEKPDEGDLEDARDLLSQLLFYTGHDSYENETIETLTKYANLYKCFNRLENTFFACDDAKLKSIIEKKELDKIPNKFIKNDAKIKYNLETLKQHSKKYKDLDSSIIKNKENLNQVKSDSTLFFGFNDTTKVLMGSIKSEIIRNQTSLFHNRSIRMDTLREQLILIQKELSIKIAAEQKEQVDIMLQMLEEISHLPLEIKAELYKAEFTGSKSFNNQMLNVGVRSSPNYEKTFTEIKLPGNYPTSSISFKMPSESEIIEATAIYLAKRVKQEAVLWFFDEMRKNTETYDLLTTAFPETITLLQSEDVFRTPNLSVAWRSALSKDFVQMPENVLSSDWLRKNMPKDQLPVLDYLSSGWNIARYVDEKFSYREIVKQLYLNKKDLPIDTTKITPNTLIDILYAFSTELYIGTDSLRLITYEDLRSMTAEELEIMLALLDMKYDACITTICSKELYDRSQLLTRDKANKLSAWMGRLLVSLNQFDLVLQELEQERERSIKDPNHKFSYYNVWSLMSEVLLELLPNEGLLIDKGHYEDVRRYIGFLNDSYEVYDMISNKNYAGSVSKIIEIVDKLVYADSVWYIYRKNPLKEIAFQRGEFTEVELWYKTVAHFFGFNLPDVFLSTTVLAEHLEQQGIRSRKVHNLLKEHGAYLGLEMPTGNNSSLKKGNVFFLNYNDFNNLKFVTKKLDKTLQNIRFKNSVPEAIQLLSDNPWQWGGRISTWNTDSLIISFPKNTIGAMVLASNDLKTLQMMRKMASFLNDVSLTEDAESLAKVVETYALPPGSYKQKRNVWCSVDFNAFVGGYFGREAAVKSQISVPDSIMAKIPKNGYVYGISAPIGISITKTFGKRLFGTSEITSAQKNNPDVIKVGKSKISTLSRLNITTTISIVDLGAIVSYRLSNTDSIASQSFRWSQFFSPGVHIGISIPNTPLVGMMGIQYTPQLRRVKPIAETPLNMARIYAGIYFDLPLYNLYTRRRVNKL